MAGMKHFPNCFFLSNGRDEAFSKLLEEIFNQVLLAQSTEQLGAAPYERTEGRTAYRNGVRERQLTTRVGTLTLRVPRHRATNYSSWHTYLKGTPSSQWSVQHRAIYALSTERAGTDAGNDGDGHQRSLYPKD